MKTLSLKGGRRIGPDAPVYLIAEVSANHNRDPRVVERLIDLAAETGFSAIKFQTYEPLEVFSGRVTTRDVHLDQMYGDRPWVEAARDEVLMPRDWFAPMFARARERGLDVFSTVHSAVDARFVAELDPPLFKVASIDVSHTTFLEALGAFGKPVLLSTGMHSLGEIEEAVAALRRGGCSEIALLHCVSVYPPRPEEVNLRNIPMLARAFGLPVGFSDHSPDNTTAFAAVALGACVVEKHVTLDHALRGADHAFSLDPAGMADLAAGVRTVEAALGSSARVLSEAERKARLMVRRSAHARVPIAAGEPLTEANVKWVRPGAGIHPRMRGQLLGRLARVAMEAEELILWEMVE